MKPCFQEDETEQEQDAHSCSLHYHQASHQGRTPVQSLSYYFEASWLWTWQLTFKKQQQKTDEQERVLTTTTNTHVCNLSQTPLTVTQLIKYTKRIVRSDLKDHSLNHWKINFLHHWNSHLTVRNTKDLSRKHMCQRTKKQLIYDDEIPMNIFILMNSKKPSMKRSQFCITSKQKVHNDFMEMYFIVMYTDSCTSRSLKVI